jgi:hypothetical protein
MQRRIGVMPSPQVPQTAPTAIRLCQRDINAADCYDDLANKAGGQHTFILFGDLDAAGKPLEGTVGVGFAGSVGKEKSFKPNRSYTCIKTTAVLQHGKGAGKRAVDATDDELYDCIVNHPPSKPYGTFSYNCRDWALEALKSAGLKPDRKEPLVPIL